MFLYLLQFKDGLRFKIGIAQSVEQRVSQLGRRHLNLDKSRFFKSSDRVIKTLEKQLHTDFDAFKAECDDLSSGNTEVFSMDCWDMVCEEVKMKQERFPDHRIKEEKLSKPENRRAFHERATPKSRRGKTFTIDGIREMYADTLQNVDKVTFVKNKDGVTLGYIIEAKNIDSAIAEPQWLPSVRTLHSYRNGGAGYNYNTDSYIDYGTSPQRVVIKVEKEHYQSWSFPSRHAKIQRVNDRLSAFIENSSKTRTPEKFAIIVECDEWVKREFSKNTEEHYQLLKRVLA